MDRAGGSKRVREEVKRGELTVLPSFSANHNLPRLVQRSVPSASSMSPATLPPEVWARIFHYLAPPLPFVGMEHESFAEDAKAWRGDHDEVRGLWKDIDRLMLVSKTMNVSPFTLLYSPCDSSVG